MFLKLSRLQRHSLLIVALLCALCSLARAQNQPNAPFNDPFNAPTAGRDMALLTGAVPIPVNAAQLRGAPLFWATGISDINDLPAYKSVGLNTVVVRLSWNPNADANNLAALDVAPQRTFADAAARAGLKVIYALPAAPKGMEFQLRIAGDSPSYNLLWSSWVNSAIGALRDTPNLTGWMLPDDPRSLPMWSDEGFRRWIGRNYATLDVLNGQWGTAYRDLNDVTQADVNVLVERNRGAATLGNSYALGPLGTADKPILTNAAFHPSALALAAYRLEAYRELLVSWIGVVRGSDPNHLLFSGAMPDYAQLLSVPAGVDVVLPAVAPGFAEYDLATHNPQAIDIARRGGKFSAMPVFSVREEGDVTAEELPDLCKRWVQEACARGAVGAGFDEWPDLKKNPNLRQALLGKLRDLSAPPYAKLWGQAPVATTAIVLTPLADGATLNYGPIALGGKRGLYGWAENLIDGEPSNLVWSMRWGTAFGGVDYLTPDDLDGPLDGYTTILAPQMLNCSLANQTALTNYVTGGGVLVADLGIGALQSGGQVGVLPPAMSLLFGVPGNYQVRSSSFNLQGATQHELFPTWSDLMGVRSAVTLTRRGLGEDAFLGPTGFSVVPPSATILALGTQIGTKLGNDVTAVLRAPLTVNSAGRGYAVFAPFRMWSSWLPGQGGFDGFHGDLMARGAALAVARNAQGLVADIVPPSTNATPGTTRFPEIVNRAGDVTLLNHDAPGQPLQLVSVETTGAGDWLWSGGIALLPNSQSTYLLGGRPAPVENASSLESRIRPLGLFAAVEAGEMRGLRMEPISAQNLGGGPLCAQVLSNARAGAEVYLWPNALEVQPDATSSLWQPIPTLPARFRLTVCSSPTGVSWAPGTRVRALATSYAVTKTRKGENKVNTINDEKFAVVDARGRASWEFEGAAVRVQIAGGQNS